jgi:hypothetical protein
MRLHVEHSFSGISLPEYEKIYFDDAFNEAQCRAVKLERHVLTYDRTESRVVRSVKCVPARDLPAPVAKMIKDNKFSYVEELDYELGKYRGHWRTIPNVASEKVDAAGTVEFAEAPGGGVRRTIRGEIKVAIFGVGGIVERFVVNEVQRSYEEAAAFTVRWIAGERD